MDKKVLEYAQEQLRQLRQPALSGRQHDEHEESLNCTNLCYASGEQKTIYTINGEEVTEEKINNLCNGILELIKKELPEEIQTNATMALIIKELQNRLEHKTINL